MGGSWEDACKACGEFVSSVRTVAGKTEGQELCPGEWSCDNKGISGIWLKGHHPTRKHHCGSDKLHDASNKRSDMTYSNESTSDAAVALAASVGIAPGAGSPLAPPPAHPPW